LIESDKPPTKVTAVGRSGSRSKAKRRAEPRQEGAPPKAKKTRQMIENPRSRKRPHISRSVTGSDDADFSTILIHQVVGARCPDYSVSDEQLKALLAAMAGMEPRDESEGMLCGLLIATQQAAMECYRRAAIGRQTFEGWRESLNQANKLGRTYAVLAETLDRHRGKGQQRITVEHVNVLAGGQAIVGVVTLGLRNDQKLAEQSSATREIAHEPGIPMRSSNPERETVPVANGARKAPV
jgi:hypothetical protein